MGSKTNEPTSVRWLEVFDDRLELPPRSAVEFYIAYCPYGNFLAPAGKHNSLTCPRRFLRRGLRLHSLDRLDRGLRQPRLQARVHGHDAYRVRGHDVYRTRTPWAAERKMTLTRAPSTRSSIRPVYRTWPPPAYGVRIAPPRSSTVCRACKARFAPQCEPSLSRQGDARTYPAASRVGSRYNSAVPYDDHAHDFPPQV